MMKRAFTLIEILVLVAVVACLTVMVLPMIQQNNRRAAQRQMGACQSNLKQIGLGFLMYEQDYDEKFPPVKVGFSMGWADSMQPYLRSQQIFQCPSAKNTAARSSDYFYNPYLARRVQSKLKSPATIILSGDGKDDAVTWNTLAQLPSDATTNSDGPAQRHLNGANYLFGDGHVKWIKPQQVQSPGYYQNGTPSLAWR